MADARIDLTTFRGKITDFNASLGDKNKRITTGLTIKRENGFVRFLKILILPLARMFGADPFSHVKANNVALAIFDAYLDYKDQLADQDKEEVYKLLSTLNQKTGNRHAVLRDIILPGVEKTVPSHLLKKVKEGFDFDIDSAVGTGSVGFTIPNPPPPPPPEDGLIQPPKEQEAPKPAVISKEDTHLGVIKKEHPKVSGDDMDHIVKMFNYPGAKIGLQRLEEEIEEFIEELDNPEYIEPEDYAHHPILAKYAQQAQEGRNIEGMADYLEDILLEAIGSARKEYNIMLKGPKKKPESVEGTTELDQDQGAVSSSGASNHATPAEAPPEKQPVDPREALHEEIAIKDELINGNKVKWMQFLIKRQESAQSYQSKLREVLQWIESGDLEDPEMIARHQTLKEIKASWEFENS